jgi:hypothetical protein
MNTKITSIGWYFAYVQLSMLFLAPFLVKVANAQSYTEIEWVQLLPEDDLAALLNPPDYLADIQDGSAQDNVDALSTFTDKDDTTRRFQKALESVRVIESFDNKSVRIPGFVVPLVSDGQQKITEFFIVPYFGACLHMPPPPPNQMIHGKVTEGFELTELTAPFWFEGVIHIKTMSNLTGTSAYTMALDNIIPYE